MAEVSLELLTDEDILDYTKSEGGKERVITDHGDYNLRFSTTLTPVNGGLYDLDMFGSPFVGQCICGHIKQESSVPCPNCGARVYSKEEALRRFARIDLAFYYLNELRFNVFKELFDQIFKDTKIKLEFFGNDLRRNGYAGRSAKKLGIKAFDTCQFTYSKAKNELKVSEFITDEKKCSYEGLLAILEKHFPGYVPEFKRLVNKEYLVLPAAMRPISAMMIGGKKKITSNPLTTWYGIITRFCSDKDEESIQRYSKVIEQFDTPGEKVRYTALLRALLNAGKKQATDLLNTSKKNEARDLYSVRVKNSARLPIVPDAELPVDRIGVPISIAYEMCREGFINYLVKELNFTVEEAKKSTQEEFENPEIQKMFKEYAEEQAVLGITGTNNLRIAGKV